MRAILNMKGQFYYNHSTNKSKEPINKQTDTSTFGRSLRRLAVQMAVGEEEALPSELQRRR